MENQLILPQEVAQIAASVSDEKRTEVQTVLNHVFQGVSKMREQLNGVEVKDHTDNLGMKLARTIRLEVRDVRLDAEKTFDKKRSEVQAQMISYKTEDSLWLKAKQTMQILTKEIEEQAKWKEETEKRFNEEQFNLKIDRRIFKVYKFKPEISRTEIESMSDESFEVFLSGLESQYNARIEAEKKSEAERIAKEKEEESKNEAARLEFIRVKEEAAQLAKKIEEERLANELAIKKQREQAQAEAEKIRLENEAKLKAEQEAKAKIEAELHTKKEAEIKAEKERIQKELAEKKEAEKLAKAPIKKQLTLWVNSFIIPEINLDSEKKDLIKQKFEAFKVWAANEIETI